MCHKKIEETDAIFEQLAILHTQAKADKRVLRLWLDAKATVAVGPFSRHGQSRGVVKAAEHLTPFGIFLPDHDELYLYFTTSPLTADFMVDCLLDFWTMVKDSFRRSRHACSTWTMAPKITRGALNSCND